MKKTVSRPPEAKPPEGVAGQNRRQDTSPAVSSDDTIKLFTSQMADLVIPEHVGIVLPARIARDQCGTGVKISSLGFSDDEIIQRYGNRTTSDARMSRT